jgi:uncharacterized protein (DUF4213/DUF364 family)
MSLLEELVASAETSGTQVQDVVIEHSLTLVAISQAETGRTHHGLVSARWGESGEYSARAEADAAAYIGLPAGETVRLALADKPVEADVGLAALNALIAGRLDAGRFRPGKLPRATDKRVVLVGEFAFTENLKAMAGDLRVIDERQASDTYAGTDAERLIRQADIVLIRGLAVLDRRLESLLELAGSCFTILYGPSTPLSPVLFRYGVDQLVGIRVRDAEAVKRSIGEGLPDMMKCPGIESVVLARD